MNTRLLLTLLIVIVAGSACDRTPATPEEPTPTAAVWASPTVRSGPADTQEPSISTPEPTVEPAPQPTDAATATPASKATVDDVADQTVVEATPTPTVEESGAADAASPASEDAADNTTDETATPTTHLVQPGENLYRISLAYGVDVQMMAAENGISNTHLIYAGQSLRIPGQVLSTTLPTTHTVRPGENLFRIGLQYGIPWPSIARQNGISNPDKVYVGQVLAIHAVLSPSAPPLPAAHTVQSGENLYRIGLYYGVPWTVIAQANGITDPTRVQAGSILTIPAPE